MIVRCDQCGEPLQPLANYCSMCGTQAPQKTVVIDDKRQKPVDNPVYCPRCGKPAPAHALYCADCGSYLYRMPAMQQFFCPRCSEKNRDSAKRCVNCSLPFDDWFSMQGVVAEHIGYKGNLVLKEKMTGNVYHFLKDDSLTIGRENDNTLTVPAPWVSKHHCRLNIRENLLMNLNAKNGTFVNRNSKPIRQAPLDTVFELNIAGIFTFTLLHIGKAHVLHLTAILNQDLCRRMTDMNKLDALRKHYFILFSGDFEINIYKINGDIGKEYDALQEAYRFKMLNEYYYFSDLSGKIQQQLFLKNKNNLPLNWEVISK